MCKNACTHQLFKHNIFCLYMCSCSYFAPSKYSWWQLCMSTCAAQLWAHTHRATQLPHTLVCTLSRSCCTCGSPEPGTKSGCVPWDSWPLRPAWGCSASSSGSKKILVPQWVKEKTTTSKERQDDMKHYGTGIQGNIISIADPGSRISMHLGPGKDTTGTGIAPWLGSAMLLTFTSGMT